MCIIGVLFSIAHKIPISSKKRFALGVVVLYQAEHKFSLFCSLLPLDK